jgi:tripartite-type tricarboxylate transporter receptor subunit TctC
MAIAGLAFALGAGSAAAQSYPTKAVKLIVPFAGGGGADTISRLVADQLSTETGKPFVVENLPGGSGVIGNQTLVQSEPDGYTLLMGTSSTTAVEALYDLTYDTVGDITPIASIGVTPNFVFVSNNLPVDSVSELVAYAKENPGVVTLGSSGIGSSPHLAGELFALKNDVEFLHVPYQGNGAIVADLLAGRVNLLFSSLGVAGEHAKAGTVKILGVSSTERFATMPDIPTVAEQLGFEGTEAGNWYGLLGPKDLPEEVITTLNEAISKVIANEDIIAKMANSGAVPMAMTSAEFVDYYKNDADLWATIVKEAEIVIPK